MKAKYSVDVTVEEVKFSKEEKASQKGGQLSGGDSIRMSGEGKEAVYSKNCVVGTEVMNLEEGSYIVTFLDGKQTVLSAEQAKEQLTISKEPEAKKPE